MARKYLGPEFDIHGGGIDLRFPHHENELAQSRAAGQGFARWWMHNAWVTTSGEKMSKSLGNSLLVSEVVKRVRPIELRYYLVASHYRSHVEFSFEALDEAATAFRRIEGYVVRVAELVGDVDVERAPQCAAFSDAMDDDLSVPAALAGLQEVIREGHGLLAAGPSDPLRGNLASVRSMLAVLGLDPLGEPWASRSSTRDGGRERSALDAVVRAELELRAKARAERDFATADAVRDRLSAAGIAVEDTPSGPRWSLAEQTPEA